MFKLFSEHDVTGYTFILPSVSVGNVGQLAVDLLISTLQPEKWAVAWHDVFIPTIGGDPYNSHKKSLSTSCELYVDPLRKLVIMQLRSPLIKENRKSFLADLVQWIKLRNFEKTIILASLSAHERFGLQLAGTPLRYFSSDNIGQQNKDVFKKLNWNVLEKRSVFPAPAQLEGNLTSSDGDFYMPQGGFTRQLYKMCIAEGLPIAVLLKFCDEGWNTPDAQLLADYLNSWLPILESTQSWQRPPSWSILYGNPPPIEIY